MWPIAVFCLYRDADLTNSCNIGESIEACASTAACGSWGRVPRPLRKMVEEEVSELRWEIGFLVPWKVGVVIEGGLGKLPQELAGCVDSPRNKSMCFFDIAAQRFFEQKLELEKPKQPGSFLNDPECPFRVH